MILKGNQRGGGSQLAVHLMNSFDNEVIEVAEVRGSVARDLSGAFAEWRAQSLSTRCKKYLYSLSISPDQSQGRLTREQYLDLIARTERSLKLVGRPRAVVFHEKRDERGELRQHAHVVWSRIDIEKNKAVQMSWDRLNLRNAARGFARDNGLELPDGMKKEGLKDRFEKRAKQENLPERQQKERTGIGKAERMKDISEAWHGTTNGSAFVHAMEDKGYYLARGDSGRYVVVDLYGEIHSLYREIEGVKSAEVKERLSGYPLDKQPDIESARAYAKQKLLERDKQQPPEVRKDAENKLAERTSALQARQQQRRADLDKQRLDLFTRHFSERGALREMQAAENNGVAAARLEKQPKGLAAFLTRITGVGSLVSWVQNKADQKREVAHKQQTEALLRRQDRESKEMDRHYTALGRLEMRESRSASTAALREGYRKLRVRTCELKPEFEKALKAQEPLRSEDGGDSRTIAAKFKRFAEGVGFTKGDLQAAFERAHNGKTVPKGDTDANGHAPADPEKLERARQLRDELNARQPRPGPDRDRDRER